MVGNKLDKRSEENLNLADLCIKKDFYLNAVAGRLYYSVFQKLKYILLRDGFDYDQFLVNIDKPKERIFSHGTIKRAFIDYCRQKSYSDYNRIHDLDQLYNIRRKADYDEIYIISKFEIEKLYGITENIIDTIDCLDN